MLKSKNLKKNPFYDQFDEYEVNNIFEQRYRQKYEKLKKRIRGRSVLYTHGISISP